MRPYQKLALVVGILWIIFILPAYMSEMGGPLNDQGYRGKGWDATLGFSFGVPLFLWWVTGTLKHIIAWFRGDKT